MSSAADAVAALAAEMAGDVAAAPEAVEQTAPVEAAPAPQAVEVPELPSWEADTEGIEDLLDGPDDDLEDDDPEVDDEPVLAQSDEYEDPVVAKLKAKIAKQEKQLKYQQDLRVKDQEKAWRAEAARRFPLADVEEISAKSKRAFLRQAAQQHERVERKVQPIISALESLRGEVIQTAQGEARDQAKAAWGQPTAGPQAPMVEAAETEVSLDRRRYKTVHDMVQARFKAGLEI